jgi:hypothetical protein
MSSEGDVVARFGFRGVAVRASAEHAHLKRYNLGAAALSASVLRLVLTGRKPSFDIDLAAFGQEPLARIRKRSKCDYAMPFSPLLLPAIAILEPRGRGQREIRHVLTGVRQSANLGVSAKIPDYDHFVD